MSRAFGDVEHKVLKEKCWEQKFEGDTLIAEPVCACACVCACSVSACASLCVRATLSSPSRCVRVLVCVRALYRRVHHCVWCPRNVRWGQEVRVDEITDKDEFIVLASDGVWDVMSSQQAVNFVRRKLFEHRDVNRAAQELIDKAAALASHDNMSVIIVCLHQLA